MENTQFKNQKEATFPTEVSQRRVGEGDAGPFCLPHKISLLKFNSSFR